MKAFWLLLLLGCVTRTQVCVTAERARAARDDFRQQDSVSASVCVDVERP